ncbi:MAG TPA: outer membrane protein assembly factor BamC [Gammaproteobacteria bacterium]|nr:outer membrane protein assembly factor BamC [Gammaproteobacteria bacterium]
MHRISTIGRRLLILLLLQQVAACSWLNETFPDRNKDYQKARPTTSLEVPPDLTTTSTTDALVVPTESTTLSGYTSARQSLQGHGSKVLPQPEGIQYEREGNRAWLVVKGDPDSVWERARDFWLENGFLIAEEDPATGVLETDWVEDRARIPEGPIRSLIGRVFPMAYSSAYRDRYRMRLERGEKPGTVEIFVTHQGVEEIVTDANDEGATKWRPRPEDPGLEAQMLKRMMLFLGAQPEQIESKKAAAGGAQPAKARAELVQAGDHQATLVIHEDYSRAWRSVGIVLDRVGFAVEDRDRLQGVYFVRYNDPLKSQDKGVLSKLAFWSDEEEKAQHYQIKLSDDGTDTRVVVLDQDGKPEQSVTAVHILNLLYDELK